jgi:hypothetical protein
MGQCIIDMVQSILNHFCSCVCASPVSDFLYLVVACSIIYSILDRGGRVNLSILFYQGHDPSKINFADFCRIYSFSF